MTTTDNRDGWCCTSCRDAVARSSQGPILEDPWEAALICVNDDAAEQVVKEWTLEDDPTHKVERTGKLVTIRYYDKRYPLDVASWAGENGHAYDSHAAATIAGL